MSARRITHDGVGIHVEVDGADDAPLVAFLHGVTGSGRTWEWLGPEVTRGRRIIRIDFRGHGRSDRAPGTYDIDHYGGDVAAVLREVSPDRPAVIAGHSLGGTVGWWLAQKHPEMTAAAFLEDPPLLQGPMTDPENAATRMLFEALRASVIADRGAGRSEADFVARIAATPTGPSPDAPTLGDVMEDDAVAAMAFGQCRLDVGVIDGAIDGSTLAGLDFRSPVSPPVFILRADDAAGAAFTADRSARLARAYPAVEIAQVPGSGHGIHDARRHRAAFTAHLQRFLDAHAPIAHE